MFNYKMAIVKPESPLPTSKFLLLLIICILSWVPVLAQSLKTRAGLFSVERDLLNGQRLSPGCGDAKTALQELIVGHLNQALKFADLAIARDPHLAVAYSVRGFAYSEMEDAAKALADMCKAEALEPRVAAMHFLDVRCVDYVDVGQYDKAIADCTRAMSFRPQEGWRYKHRADILCVEKKFDRALRDYDTGIKLAPGDEGLILARAGCLSGLRRYKEAIADYGVALAINPRDSIAYRRRADLYEKLGQKGLAARDRASSDANVHTDMEVNSLFKDTGHRPKP